MIRQSEVMHRYRHLVVGLALTDADVRLLGYAAQIARLGSVREVRFVHVLPPTAYGQVHDHDRVLTALQEQVRKHFADVPERVQRYCDVLKGPLLDRLLSFSAEQEVDLMLVGHRRDRPGRGALSRRLAMKAPCSVWIVPDGSPATIQRILMPVDFSEPAADAVQVGTSLAQLVGLKECQALHVYFNEAHATYAEYEEVLRGEEAKAFAQFIAPLNLHGVRVTPLFQEGAHVAHVIHRVAQEERIDLIVMPTRGRSRSAAILLGSVTEETIVETRIPLLVVKHFGAQLGVLQALLDRSFRTRQSPQFD
jgi:nucleotide-binding universal stress UspA family protein